MHRRQDVHHRCLPLLRSSQANCSSPKGSSKSKKSASTPIRLQRDHMMQITGRRTVPQIYVGETHVGGCDDLMALDAKGGLVPLLQAA
jgi:hypothetical protein